MRRSKFTRPNPGKDFQNLVEQSLIYLDLRYIQENVARFGVPAAPGEFDFDISSPCGQICMECKSVAIPGNVTLPPMLSPKVKSHQLKALSKAYAEGKIAGLLIDYRSVTVNKQKERRVYWLPIEQFHSLYAKYQPISSILPKHCEEFGKRIEFDGDRLMVEMIWG